MLQASLLCYLAADPFALYKPLNSSSVFKWLIVMLETQLKHRQIQLVLDIYWLFNKGMDSVLYFSVCLWPQLQYPRFYRKLILLLFLHQHPNTSLFFLELHLLHFMFTTFHLWTLEVWDTNFDGIIILDGKFFQHIYVFDD